MSYLPHIWVYAGATCEDVYAELDDKASDRTNLDIMSSPQLAFVAPGYSDDLVQKLAMDMAAGSLSAAEVQSRYCRLLHGKLGTYDAVAKVTALDRRTVKKYVGEKTD